MNDQKGMGPQTPERRRRSDRHQPERTQPTPRRPVFQPDEDRPQDIPAAQPPVVYDEYVQTPVEDDYYDDDYAPESPVKRVIQIALLGLLVILLALIAIYFVVPEGKGALGGIKSGLVKVVDSASSAIGLKKQTGPQLLKFETPDTQSMVGVRNVFTFTADKAIDGVKITDDNGQELKGIVLCINPPENTVWTLSTVFDKEMMGTLTASIQKGDRWYLTDKTVSLTVLAPTPAPIPEATVAPVVEATPAAVVPAFDQVAQGETASTDEALPAEGELPEETEPAVVATEPEPTQPTTNLIVVTQPPVAEAVATPAPTVQTIVVGMPSANTATAAPETPAETPDAGDEATDEGAMVVDTAVEGGEDTDAATDSQEGIETAAEPAEQPAQAQAATPAATMAPAPDMVMAVADSATPKKMRITEAVYKGAKKVSKFERDPAMNMQGPDHYLSYAGGVFAFRGDSYRQNAAFGDANIALKQLSIAWQTDMGSLRTTTGSVSGMGYPSQPAIVKWSVELRDMMNINDEKKGVKALKEVIAPAQDGKVYFVDLNDGQPTRDTINVGFPLKGAMAVDSQGRPMIGFGQGISMLPGKTGDIGFHLYNLLDQKKLGFINGRKTKSQTQYASNGAFDGSALFDRNSDTMIVAGENGLIYTMQLNTKFDYLDKKTLSIDPVTHYLKTKGAGESDNNTGIEAPVTMAGAYAFVADKQGLIQAIDTTTMQTVWAFDNGDNTDAALALDYKDDEWALYTGNTAFNRLRNKTEVSLRRINAQTGEEVWKYQIKCDYDKDERSGLKASPVVGQGAIADLVYFTPTKTADGATLLAINKSTGELAWQLAIPAGAMASPVAVYGREGDAYIIQADMDGKLWMVDALTGTVVNTLDLGGAIEASPAVYNDMLVIATSSKDNHKLYGIRIE